MQSERDQDDAAKLGGAERRGRRDHGLARFFGKFVLDVLPAAFVSVLGGFIFTQYHFIHAAQPQLATSSRLRRR